MTASGGGGADEAESENGAGPAKGPGSAAGSSAGDAGSSRSDAEGGSGADGAGSAPTDGASGASAVRGTGRTSEAGAGGRGGGGAPDRIVRWAGAFADRHGPLTAEPSPTVLVLRRAGGPGAAGHPPRP